MKRLLILAAALLLLALAACSAAEPAQTPEGTDTGSPEPVSWNGKGACYTAERVTYDVDAWAGCSFSYDGEEYSLLSAEDGRLMVMRGETELFSPEGSAGISMAADESGLWLASVCAEGTYLRLYDMQGAVLTETELPAAPRDMLLSGGRAWLDFGEGLLAVSPGGDCEELRLPGKYRRIIKDGEGGLHSVASVAGGGYFVAPVEDEGGFKVEDGVVGSGDEAAFLYVAKSDGVYKLDRDGANELFIDFEECQIEPGKLLEFGAVGEGRFLCDGPGGELLLRPASPDEIGKKAEVTIAVFSAHSIAEQYAAQMSAQSEDYEFKTVNYGNDANSLMRLRTELGAGGGPDLIMFSAYGRPGPLNYIVRGWLEDLTPYIDADPLVGRGNLMVWDALNEYGGVYLLGDCFDLDGFWGLKEVFGERRGMTIAEYLEMEAALEPWQDMCYHMSSEEFVTMVGGRYMRSAIDWESGSCDFDNAEFVSILEAAARVEDDRTQEHENVQSFETAWSRMGRGQLMLSSASLGASAVNGLGFDEYWTGEELSYFGYPSPDGTDGLSVQLATSFGVNVNSQHKEACWEFLSWLLRSVNVRSPSALPLYRPLFDELIEYQLEAEDIYGFEDRAAAERMCAFVESADSLSIYDENAMDIILEEAGAYFSGAQSAEQTAEYVQNRMSIYVAEQS